MAARVGFPVVVRPSYVLGGRAMAIVYDVATLDRYMSSAVDVSHDRPILIDRFLEHAKEIDVDCVADDTGAVVIGGIMEHIEEAGIHSGDSSCVVPPPFLGDRHISTIRDYTRRIAKALKVVGLMNVQYAIKDDTVYVLEVNPRASRTVPFVAKVVGIPVAKIAARIMAGEKLADFKLKPRKLNHVGVKESVFPFARFPGVDTVLGPEMKSTGEVMGIDDSFGIAFAKSQEGAMSGGLPTSGTAFVSLANRDKRAAIFPVKRLADLGFRILATSGTAAVLRRNGVPAEELRKQHEGRGDAGEKSEKNPRAPLPPQNVALIGLNRPVKRNAISDGLIAQIRIEDDADVRETRDGGEDILRSGIAEGEGSRQAGVLREIGAGQRRGA